jgi:hypothetical protein
MLTIMVKKILIPCLLVCVYSLQALPAHAFWGLLGKAGSAAGKAGAVGKAGTVGKAAAVGVAAEGAHDAALVGKGAGALNAGEDAARLGGKTTMADDVFLNKFSAVNAALPPEVAAYLSKPAKTLTATDTADMMHMYKLMSSKATKTGDFTYIEKLAKSSYTSYQPASIATKSATTSANLAAETAEGISSIEFHAFRLLLHAAIAGNKEAMNEMNRHCNGLSAEAAKQLCKT